MYVEIPPRFIYIYIYVLHIDAHTCVIHHIYVDLPSARKKMLKVLQKLWAEYNTTYGYWPHIHMFHMVAFKNKWVSSCVACPSLIEVL